VNCQEYDITLKHDALFPQMPAVPFAFETIHKERCHERTMSYINNEVETDIREQVRRKLQNNDITFTCEVKNIDIDHGLI